jgi:hypothetical protein
LIIKLQITTILACAENEQWDKCGGCEGTCSDPQVFKPLFEK